MFVVPFLFIFLWYTSIYTYILHGVTLGFIFSPTNQWGAY